ncbi:MAG: carbon starvation protein A [Candidatus Margulisiibacteriota bacterium]
MGGLLVLIGAIVFLSLGYRLYGRFLSQFVFGLDDNRKTPANEFEDGRDYVPSKKGLVFGHHFTSIAGTGPIVGPAIGVIWGWVPALIWVIFGSVFMGAVHDFGSVVVSMRHRGQSICDIANELISKRMQLLLFLVVFLALWIVIAIFGLVIAIIFDLFPESILPVWFEVPIAVGFGLCLRRFPSHFRLITFSAVLLMMLVIIIGHICPISLGNLGGMPPTGVWTVLLLIYACIASILPVQTLLQPRDFLNAWQLFIVFGILILGAVMVGGTGKLSFVAPAVVHEPMGAPSMMPFLFITIACGAISGFHSLVSSGTTSKQVSNEQHALPIGFGSMLIEAFLAVVVIVACCAGIGLGYPVSGGDVLVGQDAWQSHYSSWGASSGLASKLQAVVVGAANMMTGLGISQSLGIVIMGVFIASFAGTTLDTSTRLQRYIIAEIFGVFKINISAINGTLIAVVTGGLFSFS